ncbi:hypothetical protein WCT67_12410 [Pectobacterium parvum]|uniref:lipopolysaccharide biosynthesis protein n=1 Tax=Pectobacterium parvum TaxID=2778550 RepID=UPI003018A338
MKKSIAADFLLRMSALGGKFFLIFVMMKDLTPSDVGFYGIYSSTIMICLYFAGMDFYTYSTRELLTRSHDEFWYIIYNQSIFFILTYVVILFFWSAVLKFSGISNYVFLGYLILIVEHVSQEIYRVLIVIKKTTLANTILFIRTGLWCYICGVFIFYSDWNIGNVLITWFFSSFLSGVLGMIALLKIYPVKLDKIKLNVAWIFNGLKICFLFFIGTLFLRGINYFDKIFAQQVASLRDIGVYVFYFGMAGAIQAAIDVLVTTRYYPDMVGNLQNKKTEEAYYVFKKFKKVNLISSFLLSFLSIPICYLFISIIGKIDYLDAFLWYVLIVFGNFMMALSMPYHYFLYGFNKDKTIFAINTMSFFLFSITAWVCNLKYPDFGIYNVLFSYCLYGAFSLIAKISILKIALSRIYSYQ